MKSGNKENLTKGAAHIPRPGKKTAREESPGAHQETEAEEASGVDKAQRIPVP